MTGIYYGPCRTSNFHIPKGPFAKIRPPNNGMFVQGGDGVPSRPDLPSIGSDSFHLISDDEWNSYNKMSWASAEIKFHPPKWCMSEDAISPYGCWKLLGRDVIRPETCKDCEFCNDK